MAFQQDMQFSCSTSSELYFATMRSWQPLVSHAGAGLTLCASSSLQALLNFTVLPEATSEHIHDNSLPWSTTCGNLADLKKGVDSHQLTHGSSRSNWCDTASGFVRKDKQLYWTS